MLDEVQRFDEEMRTFDRYHVEKPRILGKQRPRQQDGWTDKVWGVVLGFIALLGFAIALTQPPSCYDPPGVAPAPTAPAIDVRHLPDRSPGSGIAMYQVEHTIAQMPPRTLARCKCGVLVMDTDEEQEGHMERAHPRAVRLDYFPEAPTT